jgi:hypothetical protein
MESSACCRLVLLRDKLHEVEEAYRASTHTRKTNEEHDYDSGQDVCR